MLVLLISWLIWSRVILLHKLRQCFFKFFAELTLLDRESTLRSLLVKKLSICSSLKRRSSSLEKLWCSSLTVPKVSENPHHILDTQSRRKSGGNECAFSHLFSALTKKKDLFMLGLMAISLSTFYEESFYFNSVKADWQIGEHWVYEWTAVECVWVEGVGSTWIVLLRFFRHVYCQCLQTSINLVSTQHPSANLVVLTILFYRQGRFVLPTTIM